MNGGSHISEEEGLPFIDLAGGVAWGRHYKEGGRNGEVRELQMNEGIGRSLVHLQHLPSQFDSSSS